MCSHTPGPWVTEECFETGIAVRVPANVGNTIVAEAWQIEDRDDGEPCKIMQANARLIAGAPAMLDALETILASFSDNGEFNSRTSEYSLPELLEIAREAYFSATACDCEGPGEYYTGVPGVIGTVRDGKIIGTPERCDSCRRYDSDEEAAAALESYLQSVVAELFPELNRESA